MILVFQICQECVSTKYIKSRQFHATEEQAEEGDTREETGEEGSKDTVRHIVGLHLDLDTLQRVGGDEGNPGTRTE